MRKIIHVDCDCFFAAVELRDQPWLKGLPVAVGGSPQRRGVLSTCNYEARAFGLHSAMPTSEALRRCPELVLLPHRFDVYKAVSSQVREIFLRYTEIIEPLSLDEAFLDVSDSDFLQGSATLIAEEIRRVIESEVGITVSAGIAPNKFLAKVASDWNKPNGQFVITPQCVDKFVQQLPVQRVPGVGKSAMRKMQLLDVETCGDLQAIALPHLVELFGAFGQRLYHLCRGKDERPVQTRRQRKSVSVEHTFSHDLYGEKACLHALPLLLNKFEQRLAAVKSEFRIHKAFVKVKFSDFTVTTMEVAVNQVGTETFSGLLRSACLRKRLPVRLLGVGVGIKPVDTERQLPLFISKDAMASSLPCPAVQGLITG